MAGKRKAPRAHMKKILVINPSRENCDYLEKHLMGLGYEVVKATSVVTANRQMNMHDDVGVIISTVGIEEDFPGKPFYKHDQGPWHLGEIDLFIDIEKSSRLKV